MSDLFVEITKVMLAQSIVEALIDVDWDSWNKTK